MKPEGFPLDPARLNDLRRKYRVEKFEIFGSRAAGVTDEESDLDIMVTFEPGARIGLGMVALKQDLEALTGLSVDLITRSSVERSPNKYFRCFALRGVTPLA
ncbi:MAG TPA: nucleotidyltransferase domain-containing protein [Candidatus Latescibacteria bacterium]|nr:nucleotidyltransferase domain-containing protein [Candidatus Latescibacterota bacterium]HOS66039.1 nucleotidyltransferase domain-containing protein [Candidatus Latescibacterota bacterium]HPK75996.1 nucleotidyltransferase domain-containing protein [Candidatus Latescibacterota bacterium]